MIHHSMILSLSMIAGFGYCTLVMVFLAVEAILTDVSVELLFWTIRSPSLGAIALDILVFGSLIYFFSNKRARKGLSKLYSQISKSL